ncbi:MAG: hypothetical protein ACLPTF_13755 [Steroidobacteraceae bacterium]
MVFTIVMCIVLIALHAVMVGLVKFAENVIATPQLVPLGEGPATTTKDNAESLK